MIKLSVLEKIEGARFLKKLIKSIVGYFSCVCHGIKWYKGVYIGKGFKLTSKELYLKNNVSIRPNCDFFPKEYIKLGLGCDIGVRNRIAGNVILEDYVLVGPDNYIASVDHVYENPDIPVMFQGIFSSTSKHENLCIGEGSWIGTHVAIIGNVHIGKHCIIGANTVITKDIPDYCVVVGNPGRIIKEYNFTTNKWEKITEQNE